MAMLANMSKRDLIENAPVMALKIGELTFRIRWMPAFQGSRDTVCTCNTNPFGCLPKWCLPSWVFTQKPVAAMKDLKYLLAYTVPVSVYLSFVSTGIWTYSAVFYAFIVLPILDVIAGESTTNLDNEVAAEKNGMWMFDAMLYGNVFIVFGLMTFLFSQLECHTYATFEMVGLLVSAGFACDQWNQRGPRARPPGFFARTTDEQIAVHALLVHALFIEHNLGII